MTADWNTGTLLMALVIVGLFIFLAVTGRLPRHDGELDRLRLLENKMKYLQDEDIRKGQLIAQLQIELGEARERIKFLEGQLSKPTNEERPLLVVMGDDPALMVDLAALRGIRGLRVTRLLPATYSALKTTLERWRRQGKPAEMVHFAVHSAPDGIRLDKVVTREELSELLRGTQIVMLMGCTSAEVADMLAVVPTVIAFREQVPSAEAWQFALLFWRAIGEGLTAATAFERAVERGPTSIGEYAELIEL